jgi:hypothetical protein
MSFSRPNRWKYVAVAAALAVAISTALGAALYRRAPAIARWHWRQTIARTPVDELPPLLKQIAQRDESLPLLAELLGDDNPQVTLAAQQAISTEVDAWRGLPADTSSVRVAALAKLLAEQAESFHSHGRFAAAQLADAMLAWPLDEDAVDVVSVFAHCEIVVRSSHDGPDALLRLASVGERASENSYPIAAPITSANDRSAPEPLLSIAVPLFGGALPIEPKQSDSTPTVDSPTSLGDVTSAAPIPPNATNPPREIYEPLAIPLRLDSSSPLPRDDRLPSPSNEPVSIVPLAEEDLRNLDDLDLMRHLHDPQQRDAVESALRQRGFDALRLEIATRLTHPDPQVRKELAGALPRIAGVEARPWLEQLAVDPNPTVRRVAISVLGTSGGLQIDTWLHQRRREETDPHIAEMIEELLDKRR